VLVNADKLRRFVGSVTTDSPANGKTKFEWDGSSVATVTWVLGRVLRSSSVVLLVYLENVKISKGSIGIPADDFFEVGMDWEVDDFEMVYDTPT